MQRDHLSLKSASSGRDASLDNKGDVMKAEQTFTNVKFVGFNQHGRRIEKIVKRIVAVDAYEAGDAIKAMFPQFEYNVRIIFGKAKRLASDAISAQVARNAGPEEC
jgi:hypothetical protein